MRLKTRRASCYVIDGQEAEEELEKAAKVVKKAKKVVRYNHLYRTFCSDAFSHHAIQACLALARLSQPPTHCHGIMA